MKALRKVFLKKDDQEIQVQMQDLKAGDVFRLEPASENDTGVDPSEWLTAVEDAFTTDDGIAGVKIRD